MSEMARGFGKAASAESVGQLFEVMTPQHCLCSFWRSWVRARKSK